MFPGLNFASMDMTISMFEAHYEYAIAARAERMMDMSQATQYAQVTKEGKNKIWNSWSQIVTRVVHSMNLRDRNTKDSVITWNGMPISKQELKKQFLSMFGRRSVEK